MKINTVKTEQFTQKDTKQGVLFNPMVEFKSRLDQIAELYEKTDAISMKIGDLKKMISFPKNAESMKQVMIHSDNIELMEKICKGDSIDIEAPVICHVSSDMSKRMARYVHYATTEKDKLGSGIVYKEAHSEHSDDKVYCINNAICLYVILKYGDNDDEVNVVDLGNLDDILHMPYSVAIAEECKQKKDVYKVDGVSLIMSEECSLRCKYCYEPDGTRNKETMTFETAKRILRKIDRGGDVTFFGGEPMLHTQLIKDVCNWGWEYRRLKYAMITNGQHIDEELVRDYLPRFDYVQVSLDGPENVNDIGRGHGSFQKAMKFAKMYKECSGKSPAFFPVLSKATLPFLTDTIKWYRELAGNFEDKHEFRILPGDVDKWEDDDFKLIQEQLDNIVQWYLDEDVFADPLFSIGAFRMAEESTFGSAQKQHECGDDNCKNDDKDKSADDTQRYEEQRCGAHRPGPKGINRDMGFCSAGRNLYAGLPDGTLVPCHYDIWADSPKTRKDEVVGVEDDPDGTNHMSQNMIRDIEGCKECEAWGCCICPGSFNQKSGEYLVPDENWCKVGKMWIAAAKKYIELRQERMKKEGNMLNALATGVNYLLDKDSKGDK